MAEISTIRASSDEELQRVIDQLFAGRHMHIVTREQNKLSSTFGSEIVVCVLPDGELVHLLCKYGPPSQTSGFGHRGGLRREAYAYQSVLSPAHIRPQFFGALESNDRSWLLIEYFPNAFRLN